MLPQISVLPFADNRLMFSDLLRQSVYSRIAGYEDAWSGTSRSCWHGRCEAGVGWVLPSPTSLQQRLVKTGGRLGQARPVLLAAAGREPPDAAAAREHVRRWV